MLKFDLKRCFLRQKLPKNSRASRADNLKSPNFSNSPRGGFKNFRLRRNLRWGGGGFKNSGPRTNLRWGGFNEGGVH